MLRNWLNAIFNKEKESFISEMMDETEKKELERIKAKYQNNLGTDYSSSHDYQSIAHVFTKYQVHGNF